MSFQTLNIFKPSFTLSLNACVLVSFGFALERAYQGLDWVAFAILTALAFLLRIFVFFSDPNQLQQYAGIYHIIKAGKQINKLSTNKIEDLLKANDKL